MIVYLVMGYLTGSMALQAHSKTNSLKDIIWRYITKYSTQHFVLVFLVSLVRILLVAAIFTVRVATSYVNHTLYLSFCKKKKNCIGLTLQGQLLLAVDFVSRHRDCLVDIALLSTVSFSFLYFSTY